MFSFVIKCFSRKTLPSPRPEPKKRNRCYEMSFRRTLVVSNYLKTTWADPRFVQPKSWRAVENHPYKYYVSWDYEGLSHVFSFQDKVKITRQLTEYLRKAKGVRYDYFLGARLWLEDGNLKLDPMESLYIEDRWGCYKTTFAQSLFPMRILNAVYYNEGKSEWTPQGLFFNLSFRLLQLWTDNLFPLTSPDPEVSLLNYTKKLKLKDGSFDFRCFLPKDIPAQVTSTLEKSFCSNTMFRTCEEGFAAFEELCEVLEPAQKKSEPLLAS